VRVAQKKESPDQPDANESDSRLQQRPASKPPPDGNLQVSLRENLGESGQEERSRSPEVGDLDCVIDNQIQYGRKVISRRNKISVWDGLDNSARMIAIKTVEVGGVEPAEPCGPDRAEHGHNPEHSKSHRHPEEQSEAQLPDPVLRLQVRGAGWK
jgi:hypothetical protein